MPTRSSLLVFIVAACMSRVFAAQGQGNYVNFESPQVKPIETAIVGTSANLSSGNPFLLVCNTPNNRVEVYDISNPDAPVLKRQIPVGLEPVSVAFRRFTMDGGGRRNLMYTANWLGDSITIVELFSTLNVFDYRMIGTFPVNAARLDATDPVQGDEPVFVAPFELDTRDFVVVAKRARSSIAILDAYSGTPMNPVAVPDQPDDRFLDVVLTNSSSFPSDPLNPPTGTFAMKEPQAILFPTGVGISAGTILVLAHKGGGSEFFEPFPPLGWSEDFDFDLWISHLDTLGSAFPIPTAPGQPACGTTNYNMATDSNGVVYVVGGEAKNDEVGNADLRALAGGFVRSTLYRVRANPLQIVERDLNLNVGPGALATVQPTDVEMYEPPGSLEKFAIVTGFSSDTLTKVRVQNTNGVLLAPGNWTVAPAAVDALAADQPPPRMAEMAGPRGVAVHNATGRAYVLAAVDHSLATYDLTTATPTLITQQSLGHDPVPEFVRRGRKFLYSTRGSGHPANATEPGFVSCSSCHYDARTDHLAWRLTTDTDVDLPNDFGGTTAAGDSLGPQLGFGLDFDFSAFEFGSDTTLLFQFFQSMIAPAPAGGFPDTGGLQPDENAKGIMVTQSLQGLANFDVKADGLLRHRFTNAPYHWRGDKKTFLDFNEAFVGLQNRSEELDGTDMELFEQCINTIHYPPNHAQLLERVYSDDPVPGSPDTGAQRGLVQWHTRPLASLGNRSCIHCHALPAGSDNRWTTAESPDSFPALADTNEQPLNTITLRGLSHKEGNLELSNAGQDPAILITGNFGFGHDGLRRRTTNSFVASNASVGSEAEPITAYLREFDVGVSPLVGRTVTVFPTDVDANGDFLPAAVEKQDMVVLMEEQVGIANVGLVALWYDDTDDTMVIHRDRTDFKQGYWYEIARTDGARYKQENATTALVRADLLKQLLTSGNKDRMIFTAVPIGSERRCASTTGQPSTPPASQATSLAVKGSATNSANAPVPALTGPGLNAVLNWNEVGDNPGEVFEKPHSVFVYEDFRTRLGLGEGHDAPRRLRFVGDSFEEGGIVRLGISTNPGPNGPDLADDFEFIDLPIFPTTQFLSGSEESARIWETFVELDPTFLYMLLLGGPRHPGVQKVLAGGTILPGDFEGPNLPANWNLYKFSYVSPSQTVLDSPILLALGL